MDKNRKLSFIIPCYLSEGLVSGVIKEIIKTVEGKNPFEIIAVNDASPDNVLKELKEAAEKDERIKVIDLAKNGGKHCALMAGYSRATGDIIVGVDDDGQCPVDCVYKLISPLEEGYDIALAKYPLKKQSKIKNMGSYVNDKMACSFLGKPKDLKLSNFYAVKRFVLEEVLKYKNPYPYIDGLFLRSTDKIINVEMQERERKAGKSGYTLKKSLKLFMNGFTAFSVKPLRFSSILGFITALLGFLFAVAVVVKKAINPLVPSGYSSIMAVLLFVGGVIMMLLGVIGEYIGRIYISINNSPQYVIREEINTKTKEE